MTAQRDYPLIKGMARMFSLFPTGALGLGLVLLRGSAALFLLLTIFTTPTLAPWLGFGLGLLALSISFGFYTKIAAGLCAAIGALSLIWPAHDPTPLIATHVINAVALVLLGPGAYSIDAIRFGHRTIGLPR